MKKFLKIWAVCLLLICLVSPAITPSQLSSSQDSFIMDVQAEELSQQGQQGLAVLIAMMLANGMRFASDTAQGLKDGVAALWDKAVNAGKVSLTLAEIAASTFWQGRNMRMNATGMTAINAFQQYLMQEYDLSVGQTQDFQYTETIANLNYVPLEAGGIITLNVPNYGNLWLKNPNTFEVRIILIGSNMSNTSRHLDCVATQKLINGMELHQGNNAVGFVRNLMAGNYYYDQLRQSTNWPGAFKQAWAEKYGYINQYYSDANIINYTYGDLSGSLDDRVILEGQTNQLVDGYIPNEDQVVSTDTDGLADYVGVGSISNTADLEAAINAAIAKGISDGLEGAIPWDLLKQALDQKVEGEDTEPIAPSEASAYKVLGLQNVFPFSIPFTLAQVFTLLEAEPVTPHFPLVMYVPGIIDYRDNVTLDDWEPVAKVTRNVGLLPLILGLILITRKIIKG